jgi:hypothetical protein
MSADCELHQWRAVIAEDSTGEGHPGFLFALASGGAMDSELDSDPQSWARVKILN